MRIIQGRHAGNNVDQRNDKVREKIALIIHAFVLAKASQ
jgi:hypothetical protein